MTLFPAYILCIFTYLTLFYLMATTLMRTFVAIQISDASRAKIAAMIEGLASKTRAIRWVSPSNLHLTLKFIGDTESNKKSALQDALDEGVLGFSPFEYTISDKGCFPNCRRPRILWLGIAAEERLKALQQRIENRLHCCGIDREIRSFKPHLTLARVRQGERIEPTLAAFKAFKMGEFRVTVRHVDLMQSELRQGGAHYTVLHRAALVDPYSKTVHPS